MTTTSGSVALRWAGRFSGVVMILVLCCFQASLGGAVVGGGGHAAVKCSPAEATALRQRNTDQVRGGSFRSADDQRILAVIDRDRG